MRLLHLIPSFGPGGAERQLSLLAPALAQLGVDCHVAYSHDGPNAAALRDSPVAMHRVQGSSNHDPRLLLQLRSLMRHVQPDLVQTWLLQMDVLGGLAASLSRCRFILSERCSVEAYPATWKWAARRAAGRRAAAIVANSSGGVAYWRSLGVERNLHLVPNCVTPRAPAAPVSAADHPEHNLILFAGRIDEQKNVLVLIDALEQALRELPEHAALLFGEGPLRAQVEQRIAASPMAQRIHLRPYTPYLDHWLRRADVFVSASLFEGHPNVVLEAAAAGCPVVLSDIAAHHDVLGEDAAFYAPADAPQHIARQLVHAANDRGLASERASRARQAVASLTVEAAARRYLDIYTRTMA